MTDEKPAEKNKEPSKELVKPGDDMLTIADLASRSDAPKVPVVKKTKNP